LQRLHDFLAEHDAHAAALAVNRLAQAPEGLLLQPRQGQRLMVYAPREVRRLLVGPYELHYEIAGDRVSLISLWHAREHR
jgi:plasmid stabilization system protein ParE